MKLMGANINRRGLLKSMAGATAGLGLMGASRGAFAADDIKIASLLDLSGGLDAAGKPMQDAITLAVEELNAAGGLLGRQISLVTYDTQTDMRLYPQYAQQAVLKDKVSAAFGGITSAAREVMRPVFRRLNTLYFYNTQYEDGVCDRNIFCTGITPAQKQSKHVPFAMNKWGKKIYTLAADYNYGQITADWTRKYCLDNGGQIVGQDFFPLDVTNFGSTIQKIQEAKPDFIYTVLVGGAHQSFYRQWAAAGMNTRIPMASTTMSIGGEQMVLSPPQGDRAPPARRQDRPRRALHDRPAADAAAGRRRGAAARGGTRHRRARRAGAMAGVPRRQCGGRAGARLLHRPDAPPRALRGRPPLCRRRPGLEGHTRPRRPHDRGRLGHLPRRPGLTQPGPLQA